MASAMLIVLSATGGLRVPDLQVEATTDAGAGLPELADAVARALVASGARVVLRGPSSGACEYCARVTVTELRPGSFRVEASQDRHAASATLRLPADSSLLDRARAIAIQARLLVTWRNSAEPGRATATRPAVRRPDGKPAPEPPSPAAATLALPPMPAPERSLALPEPAPLPALPRPAPAPLPVPPRPEPPAAERRAEPVDPPAAKYAESAPDPSRVDRVEAKPVRRAETSGAEPRRSRSVSLTVTDRPRTGPASQRPQWPWIPTAVGAGAAVGAGICAWMAWSRYDALADRTRDYSSAKALKSSGERWQLASFILSGTAVVGIGTGIVGFATRSSGSQPLTAVASPLPDGGMLAIAGAFP
jgi:hypothetical protein